MLRDLSTNWSFHAATGPPYSVGVSPEGVIGNAQSPQRDRPDRGVTNDVVVKLPDHAMDRAICTNVCSVLVRTTRLARVYTADAD